MNGVAHFFAAAGIVLTLLLGAPSEAGEAMVKPASVPVYLPKFFPFGEGEKAVYRASWNGLFLQGFGSDLENARYHYLDFRR